jgi:hypothetical protein
MASKLNIGYPKLSPDSTGSTQTDYTPPQAEELLTQWYLVTSSSTFWHDKYDISVTHSNLKSTATTDSFDNLTAYKTRGSDKPGSVKGVDSTEKANPGVFQWRGTGLLRMVSLRWELLGFGQTEGGVRWMITSAQKTMFTPPSLNIYCDKVNGVPREEADRMLEVLKDLGNEGITKELEMMKWAETS